MTMVAMAVAIVMRVITVSIGVVTGYDDGIGGGGWEWGDG